MWFCTTSHEQQASVQNLDTPPETKRALRFCWCSNSCEKSLEFLQFDSTVSNQPLFTCPLVRSTCSVQLVWVKFGLCTGGCLAIFYPWLFRDNDRLQHPEM